MLADGLGDKDDLGAWCKALLAAFVRGWPSGAEPCAVAWAGSRDEARRDVVLEQVSSAAAGFAWPPWIRLSDWVSDAFDVSILAPRPGSNAFALDQALETGADDDRAVAAGRVLASWYPLWPDAYGIGALHTWPGQRRLVGLSLQSLCNLTTDPRALRAVAHRLLAVPAENAKTAHWSRDLAGDLAREWAPDVSLRDGADQPPWSQDWLSSEFASFGRAAAPGLLSNLGVGPHGSHTELLAKGCRAFNASVPRDDLANALANWPEEGDPLWPALARHMARLSTPEDRALLENLACRPELRDPPLRWGLQYIVRGDLVLDDGSVLTLDELCEELGLPPLPYLEDRPPPMDVDWDDED